MIAGRTVLGTDGECFEGVDEFGELHFSQLKQMARSPAHYLVARATPRQENQPIAHLRFGTLVHRLALGGRGIVVYPGKRFQGNDWEAFESANRGAFIVKEEEYSRASLIAELLHADPIAGPILAGEKERAIAWDLDGRPCHSTPDVLGLDYLAELKTTGNAEPEWFKRHAIRLHYHAQCAFYRKAARAIGRVGVKRAFIVAAEVRPPFAVTVLELTERTLVEGEKLCSLWLEAVRGCELAKAWPAYAQTIQSFDVLEDVVLYGDRAGEAEDDQADELVT